ncbi:hypothetical protein AKJ48_04360 [candidate division MSBL1 archaeon SCGC-AAA261O19]|uniref:Prefoldin subunit alpha n=1 Tax=candidate division MSBL1 archaeon SCGC-AAA261O19 TaxID=1698277 RepID=A0A133V937_9EURY|nr:hypothetical protein AKJ48_04360 [candidate division MSBL1 archaeon SCGC-AAA261O19]
MEEKTEGESQELQKILLDLRESQQRAQGLQTQIKLLSNSVEEIDNTIGTIQGIKNMNSETDILVPIGGNSFLKAKLIETDKVLSGFGAELVAERNPDQAIEFLEQQKKEFNESIERARGELEKLSQHIEDLRPKAEELMAKTEGEEGASKSED